MKQKYINDINPATGEVIARVKCSTKAEILNAVNKAKRASQAWTTDLKERGKL
jgi:acyl-CoA reductase-like NAD-dependent aldehyde dehydrogenase